MIKVWASQKDEAKAASYWQKAANQILEGCLDVERKNTASELAAHAGLRLGLLYYNKSDDQTAAKYLERVAENHSSSRAGVQACLLLGIIYERWGNGERSVAHKERAKAYYQRAALQEIDADTQIKARSALAHFQSDMPKMTKPLERNRKASAQSWSPMSIANFYKSEGFTRLKKFAHVS